MHDSFIFKLVKSARPINSNQSTATKSKSQKSTSPAPVVATLRNHLIKRKAHIYLTNISIQAPQPIASRETI
jgi:hypothetical protein